MDRIVDRIWKKTKQQPSTAGPGNILGCCLVSFHFLWFILSIHSVVSENSPVIESMVKLGAVPFCQTNVPQALFTMQTSNPLYGATGNPLDKDRECGGSTGGEGSIIGAGK